MLVLAIRVTVRLSWTVWTKSEERGGWYVIQPTLDLHSPGIPFFSSRSFVVSNDWILD